MGIALETSKTAPFVILENITKKYGETTALANITMLIERGEVLGVLGPNGAGKTTLVSSISAFRKPTYGKVYVNGIDAFANKEDIRGKIGMVFQDGSLDELLTVKENLMLHAALFRVKEQEKRVNEAMVEFGIMGLKDKVIESLSGGQKQLVEIAKSLLHKPQLLIFDEPTVGLDPNVRRLIWEKITAIRQKKEATIIITSHYLEEIERLCERVVILNKGAVIADNSIYELKNSGGKKIVFRVLGGTAKSEIEKLLGVRLDELDGVYSTPVSEKISVSSIVKKLAAKKIEVKDISVKDESLESAYFKIMEGQDE